MLNYLKNIPLEGFIGLLGVIIASISLGWNMLNEIRKTPRAKVHAMVAKIVERGSSQHYDKDYLSVTISNISARPMRINGIGYDGYKWWWHPFRRKHFIVIARQIPAYLKDGEEHIEYFEYSPPQFKKLLDHNIQTIYAYDSAGRVHHMPRFKFIDFKNHVKRHVKEKLQQQK
jgi:hypothetical protein